MLTWQVGRVRIAQVVESKGASPPSFFYPDVAPEDVQRHAWLRLEARVERFQVADHGVRATFPAGLEKRL